MEYMCSICSEKFTEDSKAVSTACGHVFHDVCIGIWFENSETCPECKRQLEGTHLLRLYMVFGSSTDEELDSVMQYSRSKENVTKMYMNQLRKVKVEKLFLIVAWNILKTKKGTINKELKRATRAPNTFIDLTDPQSPSTGTVPSNSSVVEVENPPSPSFSVGVVAMQRGPLNEAAGSNTIIRFRPASAAAGRANYKRPYMVYDGLGASRQDDNIRTGERNNAKLASDKSKKLSAQAGKPGKK